MLVMEVPNVAVAPNGDRVAVLGSGEFSVHPKSVTASGTFTHTDSGVLSGEREPGRPQISWSSSAMAAASCSGRLYRQTSAVECLSCEYCSRLRSERSTGFLQYSASLVLTRQ